MIFSSEGIWITWENQRRNKGVSLALRWKLYEIIENNNRVVRYIKSLHKTLIIIRKSKPRFVAAQNPSLVLSLAVVLLKYVFRYKCIIDAHNAGLIPLESKSGILNFFSKTIQSLADLTIVTNDGLSGIVISNNGNPFVLPDKLPVPPIDIINIELTGIVNLAFICSFSTDEPYIEVIEAAKLIPDNVHIHVTGNYRGKVNPEDVPSNVKLLGYIPDDMYWSLLSSVEGIIILTKRENCLVCGAYEAVAVSKPMILSNTQAIKSYFTSGCVCTDPTILDIKMAISQLIENKAELQLEVEALAQQLRQRWDIDFANLLSWIALQKCPSSN